MSATLLENENQNESERLAELDQLQLLDTLPEACYDAVVKLASLLCETPIAFFGLIDGSRQWYKAKVGINDESTPRDLTYCQYAMLQPDTMMVVPDARVDERLSQLPFANMQRPFVFYAGLPIKSSQGHVMGALCIIDYHFRELSNEQRDGLRALGVVLENMLLERTRSMQSERELLRLRLAVDAAKLGLWDFNVANRIGSANVQFEKLLGLEPGQLDGSVDTFLKYVHPEDLPMLAEHHRRQIEMGDFKPIEFRVIHPDGTTRRLVAYSRGIYSKQKSLTRVAGLLLDRTEQYLVEEQLHSYQQELLTLTQQLETLALTDALTGIKNRRAFDELLRSHVAHGQRHGTDLSLLMLDVDHFKAFNDQYGHPEGDKILQVVAGLIQDSIRTEDSVARYGGEEFALILPSADHNCAQLTAERIRKKIELHPWPLRGITVSIGLASQSGFSIDEKMLLIDADQRLYQAKASGRNQICS